MTTVALRCGRVRRVPRQALCAVRRESSRDCLSPPSASGAPRRQAARRTQMRPHRRRIDAETRRFHAPAGKALPEYSQIRSFGLSHQGKKFRRCQNEDAFSSLRKVSFIVRNNYPSALDGKVQHQFIVRVGQGRTHRINGRYEVRGLENVVEESVHVLAGQRGNQLAAFQTSSYSSATATEIFDRKSPAPIRLTIWYEAPCRERSAATRTFVSSTISCIGFFQCYPAPSFHSLEFAPAWREISCRLTDTGTSRDRGRLRSHSPPTRLRANQAALRGASPSVIAANRDAWRPRP